ncbi:MAG: hypothetical protein M0P70_01710 [Desulfobulbaceae bacterium]|nr:hypothetical protein [Desulfobulbaceae bacterium]
MASSRIVIYFLLIAVVRKYTGKRQALLQRRLLRSNLCKTGKIGRLG